MYLVGVKKLYTKELVSYAINKRMTADLACNALNMAIKNKRPSSGLIVHSDGGSQYCSHAYHQIEPPRYCRRPNFLREYDNENTKLHSEIKERAVRMLIEAAGDYPSTWSAIQAIAPKIGCTPETLRSWHNKHIDQTIPASVQAQSQEQRIKDLERENKELKQANEIIRKAAAFFAQAELDRPPR